MHVLCLFIYYMTTIPIVLPYGTKNFFIISIIDQYFEEKKNLFKYIPIRRMHLC